MNNSDKGKKNKQQKKTLRVDFTPMVDMNMLLITFFMFCTTLSIPQVMKIALPAPEGKANVPESKTITILLGENDKVFYYEGKPDYKDYTSLKETDYKGLRNKILERNRANFQKINDLRIKRHNKEIDENFYTEQISEIKKSKEGLNVIIKPTKDANYSNLVDVLDEMQICGVGKYSIIDLEESDNFLMENLKTKGALTAMVD